MSYRWLLAAEWRFLAAGFALCFFSSFGQTYFIGVFGGAVREEFGLSHADYGLLYSVATLLSGFTLLFVGRAVDRYDLRVCVLAVSVALVVACSVLASAPGVGVLVGAIFLLRLGGQGLMGHIAMTAMGRYFAANRAKAISLAAMGFAAGEAVWPRSAFALLESMSWRSIWFGLSGIALLVALPLLQWLLRGHGARHAAYLEGLAADAGGSASTDRPQRHWTRGEVARDRRFYLVLPAALGPAMILTGMFFHQVRLMELEGWSASLYGNSFVAFAMVQVVAGLLTGPWTDRFSAGRLLPLLQLPIAAALMFLFAEGTWVCPAYLVCLGVAAGATGVITGSLWAELYGVAHLGAIRAMVTACMVFSTAVSPYVMGEVLDRGATTQGVAQGWLTYIVLSSLLAWLGTRARRNP